MNQGSKIFTTNNLTLISNGNIFNQSTIRIKINSIQYYDNIRVITNENDTELITVFKDKFDKSEVNVKYGKWDKVK